MDRWQSPGHADIRVAACLPVTIHVAQHFIARVTQGATLHIASLSGITLLFLKREFIVHKVHIVNIMYRESKLKLRGLSPRANYTDRAAAAGRRS
jgi:hypothetical protein